MTGRKKNQIFGKYGIVPPFKNLFFFQSFNLQSSLIMLVGIVLEGTTLCLLLLDPGVMCDL